MIMDKICQEECYQLIKKYKKLTREGYKAKYRNQLYDKLKDYIAIWMKSTLGRWKRHMEEGDIVSYSWDVFYFCLDSYDPEKFDTHVPYFFSRYTNYWLLMHFAKIDNGLSIPLEELQETLMVVESPENIAFGKLLKLYTYREVLPEDVKIVWDDAFLSLSHLNSDKQNFKSKDIQLPQKVYYMLKESFKGIIKLILEE